jgi:hypothetical protein
VRSLAACFRPPPLPQHLGSMGATVDAMTSQIQSGQDTFNKAYSAAGGSLQGTAAAGAGIVADLPSGQFKSALDQAMSAIGYAEAGAAIGSIIPGYGTAVGAVIGGLIGIFSTMTSSPLNTDGEFRSTAEQYIFPALALTPTVGETPSQLAQTVLQPCVFPTYRQHAVSWMPVTVDEDFGAPYLNESKPLNFTFGVGWLSPPGSTTTSTEQGYYLASAWMATDGVSRGLALAHDDSNGDLHAYGATMREQAITALGSEQAYNAAMGLFESWYGSGSPWSTKIDPALAGTIPKVLDPVQGMSTTWNNSGKSLGYKNRWGSLILSLREPNQQFDWTYYAGNYLLANLDNFASWSPVGVSETMFNAVRADQGPLQVYNVALLPDTTAIGLAELACLAVTGEGTPPLTRQGADVAALHFLLGMAWLWRQGYAQDSVRSKNVGEVYGLLGNGGLAPYQPTNPNVSRCIGIVQAKIRKDAKKNAPKPKPKANAPKPSAAVVQKAATANASLARTVVVTQANAALAAGVAPLALVSSAPAPAGPSDEELAIGVALAAAVAGAVLWKKRKRRQHG